MRNRKLKKLEWLMLLAPLALLTFVFAPRFFAPPDKVFRGDVQRANWTNWMYTIGLRGRESGGRSNMCASDLRQIGIAMAMYQQDYGDCYPTISNATATHGWAGEIAVYVRNNALFQCPQQGGASSGNPRLNGFTDYWMNGNLSGVPQKALKHPRQVFLLGEGNGGFDISDARYSKTSIPASWIADKTSPAWRHLTDEVWARGGANYLYADGHVKRFSPQQLAQILHDDPFRIR